MNLFTFLKRKWLYRNSQKCKSLLVVAQHSIQSTIHRIDWWGDGNRRIRIGGKSWNDRMGYHHTVDLSPYDEDEKTKRAYEMLTWCLTSMEYLDEFHWTFNNWFSLHRYSRPNVVRLDDLKTITFHFESSDHALEFTLRF